jgi:Flp pilus assembly pilin Flp
MKGQAMVEYLLLTVIAVTLLAVPFGDQPSVVSLFLEAVRTAYAKFLAAMSLPQ